MSSDDDDTDNSEFEGKARHLNEEEIKEKEEKEEKKVLSIKLQLCIGFCIVIAFYGLLALIIYLVRSDNQGETISQNGPGKGTEKEILLTTRDGSCTVDAFMMRDGVCDDKTNVPHCLFDGGDCCKNVQTKRVHLCRDCSCQESLSEDQMSSAIQAGAVEKYRFRKVRKPVYEIVETFMDVVSETVCISVCLPNNAINSGVFNHTSKTCLCTLIGGFCRNIFAEKLDVLDEPPSNLTAELNMFVKMANVSVMLGCHSDKIILVGGRQGEWTEDWETMTTVSNFTKTLEVIDSGQLDNEDVVCSPLPSLDKSSARAQAVGGLLNGEIFLLCGGNNHSLDPIPQGNSVHYQGSSAFFTKHMLDIAALKTCLKIAQSGLISEDKNNLISMKEARNLAAAIVISGEEEKLFIVGGMDADLDNCDIKISSTTEYVSLNELAQYGPELPIRITGHCLVKIEGGDAAIAMFGFYRSTAGTMLGSRRSFFIDLITETWSEGPTTVRERRGAFCGEVIDSHTRKKIVVGIGGVNDNQGIGWGTGDKIRSELWIEGSPEFIEGPLIPGYIVDGAAVSNAEGSRLIMMGGADLDFTMTFKPPESDRIFTFQCSNHVCSFNEIKKTLKYPRTFFVALNIPDSWSECVEKHPQDVENDTSAEDLVEMTSLFNCFA